MWVTDIHCEYCVGMEINILLLQENTWMSFTNLVMILIWTHTHDFCFTVKNQIWLKLIWKVDLVLVKWDFQVLVKSYFLFEWQLFVQKICYVNMLCHKLIELGIHELFIFLYENQLPYLKNAYWWPSYNIPSQYCYSSVYSYINS
jgi:hypothetical protein